MKLDKINSYSEDELADLAKHIVDSMDMDATIEQAEQNVYNWLYELGDDEVKEQLEIYGGNDAPLSD